MSQLSRIRRNEIKAAVIRAISILKPIDRALPIKVEKIPKMISNCCLITYSDCYETTGETTEWISKTLDSSDAFLSYNGKLKAFILAYNDAEPYLKTNRYRWNIAHELGHLFLGHLDAMPATSISRGGLSSKQYRLLEDEADYFASLLLVPFVLLQKLPLGITTTKIKDLCHVSKQAADISHQHYKNWLKSTYDSFDKKVFELFKPYYYRMQCNNCKVAYVGGYNTYCHICGSNDISFLLKGESMKYYGIETNAVNRPYECPHCKNEEIDDDAIYCKICGNVVVNMCTNPDCNNSSYPLMGNARYCPICGSATTYLDNEYISAIILESEEDLPF